MMIRIVFVGGWVARVMHVDDRRGMVELMGCRDEWTLLFVIELGPGFGRRILRFHAIVESFQGFLSKIERKNKARLVGDG